MEILGVYDWSGNNPIFPELWLSPQFLPFHPGISLAKWYLSNLQGIIHWKHGFAEFEHFLLQGNSGA